MASADFGIAPLVTRGEAGLDYDAAALDSLVGDLAGASRPGLAGPTATVGALGFSFGYQLSQAPPRSTRAWALATRDNAPDTLGTSQVFVRKGLPSSLELGATLAWFHDLDLQAVAFEFKWAFYEGVDAAPELGARLHAGAIIGQPDLTVVTTGADLTVGKRFGLAGVLRLSPYAGYAFSFAHSIPRPIGVVLPGDVLATTAVLPAANVVTHRGLLGLEVTFGSASAAFEVGLGETTSWTLRLAANL